MRLVSIGMRSTSRADGRQTRRRPAEVRRLLIDAAAEAFREKGFDGATNEEIADRAGVALSVLFRNFRTKGALFRAAVLQPFLESVGEYRALWRKPGDEQKLTEEDLMSSFLAGLHANLETHREAVSGLLMADKFLDEEGAAGLGSSFEAIFDELYSMGQDEAERRKWFSEHDLDLTLRVMVGAVTGMVTYGRWLLPADNRVSPEKLVAHMSKLMLYGVRLSPPVAVGGPGDS
jgi:AcrR family transcriptional regulator